MSRTTTSGAAKKTSRRSTTRPSSKSTTSSRRRKPRSWRSKGLLSSNLVRRILVAAVGIPAALGLVYLGGWVLATALAVLGVAGAREVYRLAERTGVQPLDAIGYVGAALLPVGVLGAISRTLGLAPIGLLVGGTLWVLLVMTVALRLRPPASRPLSAVAVTVFGVVYAAGLPAFLLALRYAETVPSAWAGTWLVFLPLVITWVGDSLAMAGGRLFGGPKMAPVLSPNKTWAGGFAGAAAGLLVGPVYGTLILAPAGMVIPAWQLGVFGLAVAIVGQTGDLAESLFKREAGVKDSGTFFPGHGGVLDRLDSLYWVLPASVAMLLLLDVI